MSPVFVVKWITRFVGHVLEVFLEIGLQVAMLTSRQQTVGDRHVNNKQQDDGVLRSSARQKNAANRTNAHRQHDKLRCGNCGRLHGTPPSWKAGQQRREAYWQGHASDPASGRGSRHTDQNCTIIIMGGPAVTTAMSLSTCSWLNCAITAASFTRSSRSIRVGSTFSICGAYLKR